MGQVEIILWATLGLTGLLVIWLGWLALVSWHYRIRAVPRPVVHWAVAGDGWRLAIHHRAPRERRYREPVLLSHGLAANRHTFEFDPPYSIAHALSAAGFDCYTVEWRGTGYSGRSPRGRAWWSYDVDDHIELDAPAVIDRVLELSGAPRLFWVGHSLGGLVGYAVAQGAMRERLAGLVALGAPVFFGDDPVVRAAVKLGAVAAWPFGLRQRLMSLSLAPWLGYVALPLSDLLVNPQHIEPPIQRKVYARMISAMGRFVLEQLRDWVEHDVFRSFDRRVDYRAGFPELTVPLLAMGGSSDRLATPVSLDRQFQLAGSADKTQVLFGKDRGDAFDYGHGDLLFGTGAPNEVYPVLAQWLSQRATLAGAAPVEVAAAQVTWR